MGTVVGIWRLKVIMLLTIFLTTFYIVNAFIYSLPIDDAGYYVSPESSNQDYFNTSFEPENSFGDDIFSLLVTAGDYLTFGNIENIYVRLLLNFIVSLCWLTIGYLIYTFIKEWVPLT